VSEIDSSKIERIPAPLPTLCGYYADPKAKPTSFLKAVRAAKIKAFQSNDVESAQATYAEKDSDLSRTLALGLGNRAPEAVERWVIDAARSEVRTLDPNIMLEESASAEAIFERVVQALTDGLQSKKKTLRSRAQNLVKLSMIWLIRRRSLDPQRALYALSGGSGKRPARETPRSEAQKVLLRAKPSQWRTLFVVANLNTKEVEEADRSRNEALQARDRLQRRLAELESALESKQQETDSLSREFQRLEAELMSSKSALEAQRQLRELDAAEAAGRTRNLLAGRLSLLLSDARDALDFEPPHVEAARQRIDAARQTIAQEVDDSND
jgi:hypothetical protein